MLNYCNYICINYVYLKVNELFFFIFKVVMNNVEVSCEYCKFLKFNIEVR